MYKIGMKMKDEIVWVYYRRVDRSVFVNLNQYYRCPKQVKLLIGKDDIKELTQHTVFYHSGFFRKRDRFSKETFLSDLHSPLVANFLFDGGTWYVCHYRKPKVKLLSDFVKQGYHYTL